ncbi:hypothetical protein BGZ63DRAFT_366952 [Mariannaea sp. PMI_226]|nr:hypothetical protein BGZ63DRAFT_366952 [Mariannaea sp. PMI_226]
MTDRGFGSGNHGLSPTSLVVIVAFLSLALYNVIELTFMIGGTFKRYSGVYFWSFSVATFGIALNCSGFFIKFFGPFTLGFGYLSCTLSLAGWVCMVTGQSMVLWSRLHLIMHSETRIRLVLWIIIANAVVLHGTIIPMVFGSFSTNPKIWLKPYSIAEKFELVIFFLQEFMLSSLYIFLTIGLMKIEQPLGNRSSSRLLMKHLIFVNCLVIILDITILALEFANQYDFQISYKPFAYSVKLKLEFSILNRLVDLTSRGWELASADQADSIATSTVSPSPSKFSARRAVANIRALSTTHSLPESSKKRASSSSSRKGKEVMMMPTGIASHWEERFEQSLREVSQTESCTFSSPR